MKNQIDFKASLSGMGSANFINCFAAVYVHLEKTTLTSEHYPGIRNYFQMFDAMSGESFVHRHYGGKPTEMQKLIGNHGDWGCGTDYTIDFLFGFAGYEYFKQTDSALFKDGIITSINAGKPVLAKIKPDKNNGTFQIITGYDGDILQTSSHADAQNAPTRSLVYDDIDSLIIINNKITSRFTLVDGLKRTKQMMECNRNEKVWDKYIEEIQSKIMLPDEIPDDLKPEEQKKVMSELTAAVWCAWTNWNYLCAFEFGTLCIDYPILNEIPGEALDRFKEIEKLVWKKCCESMDLGHFINYLNKRIEFQNAPCPWFWLGKMLVMMVERYKELDAELLDLIEQKIEIFDKK